MDAMIRGRIRLVGRIRPRYGPKRRQGRPAIEESLETPESFPVDRRSAHRHRIGLTTEDDPAQAEVVERMCRKRT